MNKILFDKMFFFVWHRSNMHHMVHVTLAAYPLKLSIGFEYKSIMLQLKET